MTRFVRYNRDEYLKLVRNTQTTFYFLIKKIISLTQKRTEKMNNHLHICGSVEFN
jgi:hypothetical protein